MSNFDGILNMPKTWEEIMTYQNSAVLKRFRTDHGGTQKQAEKCFLALKQFFAVCVNKSGYNVVSDEIDKMWHTFLLFTKDYREFCGQYFGQFIEHAPFETPVPEAYLETRAYALRVFGKLDPKVWSVDAKTDCSSSCII